MFFDRTGIPTTIKYFVTGPRHVWGGAGANKRRKIIFKNVLFTVVVLIKNI